MSKGTQETLTILSMKDLQQIVKEKELVENEIKRIYYDPNYVSKVPLEMLIFEKEKLELVFMHKMQQIHNINNINSKIPKKTMIFVNRTK